MNLSTMFAAAAGVAVGAATVCLATKDRREMQRTVHRLAKGAEKTLADLDKAVQLGTPQGVVQALYNLTR